MGRLSDAQANHLLDLYFSKVANAAPATIYVGLSTTTPSNTGTGVTEPSGFAYARVAVTNNATNFPAATARAKTNGTDINFPTATGGSWGTCTHFVMYDALTAGNFIAWGALTVPVSVIDGATVSFVTGSLVINAPGA